jgi:thioredoxin 1
MKNEVVAEITDEEFNQIIGSSNNLVVVDFFAEWCMPCLMVSPIVEELSKKMKEVKFVKINIEDNSDLAVKNKVANIPCLVIFKNGKEVDRVVGARPADVIEEKIKNYL